MMSIKLFSSVGKGGKNAAKDVRLVQALLNVYARANDKSVLIVDGKTSGALEAAISAFQKDYVKLKKPDGNVGVNGRTFKKLKEVLSSRFKAKALTNPSFGLVTWQAEGAEGGFYHSRKLHVPSSASGLTIGRGYDMKTKSASTIAQDLVSAGVEAKTAAILKQASGLFGTTASQFIIDNDLLDFEISPEVQKKLFKLSYDAESDQVKRICEKKDVELAYGKTDWAKLNSTIRDITIDLKFRGDYTGTTRKVIQSSLVANDLAAFKTALKDKSNWPGVPKNRFDRRNTFLNSVK
jgi:peptidoglycan hydrolase-like protein with peptidoglycan-binding domain